MPGVYRLWKRHERKNEPFSSKIIETAEKWTRHATRSLTDAAIDGSLLASDALQMNWLEGSRRAEFYGYEVVVWGTNRFIDSLWRDFPELVVGRFMVNTSYDSGFLTLAPQEERAGWRRIGNLAHSPQIKDVSEVPHDTFDEWLVFERPVEVRQFETMVNHYGFAPLASESDDSCARFWEQVVRLNPLHVIGENDGMYLVSREKKLVSKILRA